MSKANEILNEAGTSNLVTSTYLYAIMLDNTRDNKEVFHSVDGTGTYSDTIAKAKTFLSNGSAERLIKTMMENPRSYWNTSVCKNPRVVTLELKLLSPNTSF